ncbi:MAG: neutral/alkaline non-lysosomal ceramidase N-terminal domain-containing protein, partial [Planctomycetes bacterium]|nr:neutral/alkaline non-lysosomal ceramidase N-terminal domain-containing protein [Planctomycetota bacterium]
MMCRWPAVAAILLLGVSCADVAMTTPREPSPARLGGPSGAFRAGAAWRDITPLPGVSMGGYSIASKRARGVWKRLKARAFYFEDAAGQGLTMVSCDTWAIPMALHDRVAELLSADPATEHLRRDRILLAATHTHHSGGNYAGCKLWNAFAQQRHGFDRDLFEFYAARIVQAVREAVQRGEPARVDFYQGEARGIARNRSLEAWRLNRDVSPVSIPDDPMARRQVERQA